VPAFSSQAQKSKKKQKKAKKQLTEDKEKIFFPPAKDEVCQLT
jgi:hypothetical protein